MLPEIVNNEFEVVLYHSVIHHFDYDLAVDWGMMLIQQGIETENILYLGTAFKPADERDVRLYLELIIDEFKLNVATDRLKLLGYIHYYVKKILANEFVLFPLKELNDLFYQLGDFNSNNEYELKAFHFLYEECYEIVYITNAQQQPNQIKRTTDYQNLASKTQETAKLWKEKFGFEVETMSFS